MRRLSDNTKGRIKLIILRIIVYSILAFLTILSSVSKSPDTRYWTRLSPGYICCS